MIYTELLANSTGSLKAWTTFMARINEAPSVSFTGGGGTALDRDSEWRNGLYQTSNNLPGGTITGIYRVVRSPLSRPRNRGSDRHWAPGRRRASSCWNGSRTAPIRATRTRHRTCSRQGSIIFVGNGPAEPKPARYGVPSGFPIRSSVCGTTGCCSMWGTRRQSLCPMPIRSISTGDHSPKLSPWPPDNPEKTTFNTTISPFCGSAIT